MQIDEVNYKILPSHAASMRSEGTKLNRHLINAYNKIGVMGGDWYGVRYDALVTECNKIIPEINDMLKLVVDTIPFTLQQIANNYAKVDGSSTAVPTNQNPTNITEVAKSGKTTMRFIEGKVSSMKTDIFTDFKNALQSMDTIEQLFNSNIKSAWKSDAATRYASKFAELKSSIATSLNNVKTSFDRLVQETIADMKHVEQSNTVY